MILWILAGGVLLLLVVGLLVFRSIVASKAELDRTLAELQSCGESFSVGDLTTRPAMSQAAHRLFTAANRIAADERKVMESLSPFAVWRETEPGKVIPVYRLNPVREGDAATSWDSLEVALQPVQPIIQDLLEATESGPLDAHPDYAYGFTLTMDEQFVLISSARILGASALVDMHFGRSAEAARKIVAVLRVANMVSRQHLLISQMMTYSLITIAQHLTWNFLSTPDSQEALLAGLQTEWESLQIATRFVSALRVERALALDFIKAQMDGPSIASSATSLSASLPSTYAEWHHLANILWWKTFYRYSDTKSFVLQYQGLIDSVPVSDFTESWGDYLDASKSMESVLRSAEYSRWLSRVMTPVMQGMGERTAMAETAKGLTITALAIRRYELQHEGQLPSSLDDLIPQFLPGLPADPFGENALTYRPGDRGDYVLYSVGIDRLDQGGDATPLPAGKRTSRPPERRDIVWPQIAPTVFAPQ